MMNSFPVVPLPIDSVIPDLKRAVSDNANVVLQAPPGAGKTTRVPVVLLDLLPPASGRIVMLEPRRLAAFHAAHHMAGSLGEQVGETVGYTMRFDRRVSRKTRIDVVTEGVLARRLQKDPCLEGISMVIFDEFHERSLQADLALALCLEVQREVRPDLKILVMSATLDGRAVADLLGAAPVIVSLGQSFPVEVCYLDNAAHSPLPVRMCKAIRLALSQADGDILAFLPGSPEIRACNELLMKETGLPQIAIRPLYGDLPFAEQQQAVKSSQSRKIVLATNIAETSLTIEGVRVVIDSGLSRMVRHDLASGMNRLVTVRESKSSAEQRRGRAGRLAPGICYRLFGKHTFDAMTGFSPPEILTSDLSSLVLELAVWGLRDPASLRWLDPPPPKGIAAAKDLLLNLGALDRNGLPTETGRRMTEFPVHPRLARMLLRGKELAMADMAALLAALVSERDIFHYGPGKTAPACESDLMDRLEFLCAFGKPVNVHVHEAALKTVQRAAAQLIRLVDGNAAKLPRRLVSDPDNVARLLLTSYPDRVACRRGGTGIAYLLANGRGACLSSKSGVRNRPLILAVHVDGGEKGDGVIHQACSLSPELVRSECGSRLEKGKRVFWDYGLQRVLACEEETLGAVTLSRKQKRTSDEEALPVVLPAVFASRMELLGWNHDARQLVGRAKLVRQAYPEENWPDMSYESLLARLPEWFGPFLAGARSAQEIASINLVPALKTLFSWEQVRLLDERVPTHIVVPSGNRIEIDYSPDDGPVLAVKLQEMFGLGCTPATAGGRVNLVLHLLSPAGRPVQVTRDLRGFWDSGYRDVKKEFKGRYPKHPWPEDPWNAVPTRMTNRMLKNRK